MLATSSRVTNAFKFPRTALHTVPFNTDDGGNYFGIQQRRRKQIQTVLNDTGFHDFHIIADHIGEMGLPKSVGMLPARIPLVSSAHQFLREKQPDLAFQCLIAFNNLGLDVTPSMQRTTKYTMNALLDRVQESNDCPRGRQFNDELTVKRIRDPWLRKALQTYLIAGSPPGRMRETIIHALLERGEFYSATLVFLHGILADPVSEQTHSLHPLQASFDTLVTALVAEMPLPRENTIRHTVSQSICSLGTLAQMRAYPRGLNIGSLIDTLFAYKDRQDQVWAPINVPQRCPTLRMAEVPRAHQTFGSYAHGILFSLARRLPKSQLTAEALISLVAGLCDVRLDPILAERSWKALLISHLQPAKSTNFQDLDAERASRLQTFVELTRPKIQTEGGRGRFERIVLRSRWLVQEMEEPYRRGSKEDVIDRVLTTIVHLEVDTKSTALRNKFV